VDVQHQGPAIVDPEDQNRFGKAAEDADIGGCDIIDCSLVQNPTGTQKKAEGDADE
jgi:hypothetical protein